MCLKGVGSDVGHISLNTDGLDSELIEELLSSAKEDWTATFGRLKTNSSKTVSEASKAAALVDTVKKHRSFQDTPSKINVITLHDNDISDFEKVSTELENLLVSKEDKDVKRVFLLQGSEYQYQMEKENFRCRWNSFMSLRYQLNKFCW